MDNEKTGLLERDQISKEYKWDLESMYENDELWEEDFKKVKVLADEIVVYSGKTVENSKNLMKVLVLKDNLYRLSYNVLVYARMRSDEDSRNSTYQALTDRAMGLAALVQEKTSFIVPEILSLDKSEMEKYIN